MCGTVCKGLAMGCKYHELANDCHAKFNEFDDKTSCLCSVNLHRGDLPNQSQVRSLAMLGAALLYSQQALDSGDHSVKKRQIDSGNVARQTKISDRRSIHTER
jgi:hypothetical protein